MTMSLTDFNAASSADAAAAVRPCLDVDRWVNAIVDKRPYPDLDSVVAVARSAADPFTEDELITALSHHPRIGERASGATAEAGRVAIGTEVRLVLDAAPQYVIPARATFVADVAQFTPKTVETEEERQKLMFRIKAKIAPELLRKYIQQVKTGLPGVAYIRLDPKAEWPAALKGTLLQ